MDLSQSIKKLPHTSSITIKRLKELEIRTFWDLINYFPFRYESYQKGIKGGVFSSKEKVSVRGKLIEIKNQYIRRGLTIQKGFLSLLENNRFQKTNLIIELVWYNQPYLIRGLKQTQYLSVAGKLKRFGSKLTITVESYDALKDADSPVIHSGAIVPIYSAKRGLSGRTIREKINFVLSELRENQPKEFLPKRVIDFNQLISEDDAYKNIHFPTSSKASKSSKERLSFDELFLIQLSAKLTRLSWEKEKQPHNLAIKEKREKIGKFISNLPFELTDDQKKVCKEIFSDMKKNRSMNRFLQGDVGSGKTVVALLACYLSYLNGHQSLFMVPTEILANQHFRAIKKLLSRIKGKKPSLLLVTRFSKPKTNELRKGDIIIGTHSLLNEKIKLDKVALVVIDEQHRFGVRQRAKLKKKGINPHLLTMTATPIPRTVLLSLYGELDVSIINQKPKGRLKVKTYLVPPQKRNKGYQWIKKQIKKNGAQVFIICPLIEESTTETLKTLKAAKKEYERLSKHIFTGFNLSLIHGRMKGEEKNKIMEKFKGKKIDILVATSLVEVGIDIPDATIIIIEGAERFGLAQLHQLRGRVGRSNKQSYCFLFTDKKDKKIINRLSFFSKNHRGVDLAKYDLKTRGPGDVYGTRQHGFIDLKIASLMDLNMVEKVKGSVEYFVSHFDDLSKFKELQRRLDRLKLNYISRD